VASTKAFTSQLTALLLLASYLGQVRGKMTEEAARTLMQESRAFRTRSRRSCKRMKLVSTKTWRVNSFATLISSILGRGIHYPIALEGALKLKEISYIHAEGYPPAR